MFGVFRSGAVLSLLMFFVTEAVVAQSTNKVSIDSPSVTAGQQGVVTISVSNDEPMTLINFDLTFATSFCDAIVLDKSECVGNGDPSSCCTGEGTGDCGPKLETLTTQTRMTVDPQEGGNRCPTEGRMSFIFLDGSFTGDPILAKCTCLGDANKSGFINVFDFGEVQANFLQAASGDEALGDANCSGFINVFDFGEIQANFLTACPPSAVGGAIARWVFDVRNDATTGAVSVAVVTADSTNGPVTLCETGGVVDPPSSCTTPIGSVGGSITINAGP